MGEGGSVDPAGGRAEGRVARSGRRSGGAQAHSRPVGAPHGALGGVHRAEVPTCEACRDETSQSTFVQNDGRTLTHDRSAWSLSALADTIRVGAFAALVVCCCAFFSADESTAWPVGHGEDRATG